ILALTIYIFDRLGALPPHTTLSDPLLPAVLAVTSFGTVIYGLRSTKMLTAVREIRLGKLAAIEMTAQTISIASTILLSLVYPSVWPLVFGAILSSLLTAGLSHIWISRFPDRFGWDHSAIREFYISGRWILASSGIQALATNADRFILAALASPTFLGLYSLAINFVLLVEVACGKLMSDVAYPALCEAARDKNSQFKHALRRIRFQIDSCYLLASGAFFASGQAIIDLLYDPRYAAAGQTLQVLALGLFFHRYLMFPFAYMALGQPQLMAVVNAVRLAGLIAMASTGWWIAELNGVVYGIALSTIPPAVAILWINRRFGLNDLKIELAVLPMWVMGYLLGLVAATTVRSLSG
ncbi:MAG: oligosaccharide flippase family protein, partial [Cyanobacteria bacterium J06648_11]